MERPEREKTEIFPRNGEVGRGLFGLSPLIVFLTVYLAVNVVAGDFNAVPIATAFLFASIYSVFTLRGVPLRERIEKFSAGAADPNILTMIWIFILAGAFSGSALAVGAIDDTVNMTLRLLPDSKVIPGIFLASCFISLAIGTSVGTIAALVPLAVGIAGRTGLEIPFVTAVVVGGAFFGDNLSFISDTTIAATRTQGVAMRDKFKANLLIVLPAATIVLLVYLLVSPSAVTMDDPVALRWTGVIPYLAVLILAIAGMNVNLVLLLGIVLTGLAGIISGGTGPFEWTAALGDGIAAMGELIVVTLLAGGLLHIVRLNGGMDFLVSRLTRRVKDRRGAEFCIAAVVSAANVCTANNTIAIITTGSIARDITSAFGLDPRKSASLLDTFSCFVQGVIPYGAQILIASRIAGILPTSIVPYLYYPFTLGAVALLSIVFRFPRKYSGGSSPR